MLLYNKNNFIIFYYIDMKIGEKKNEIINNNECEIFILYIFWLNGCNERREYVYFFCDSYVWNSFKKVLSLVLSWFLCVFFGGW